MNRRRSNTSTTQTQSQQGISKFVEKRKKPETTGKGTSTTSSTSKPSQKRTRQSSLSPSTEKPANKKQVMQQGHSTTMESTNTSNNKKPTIELNPELCELKRQLFEGFEQLIEPLKRDIEDLKTDRDNRNAALNVETVSRRFRNNDERHRKLESRLNCIEDQLLEKNLIFQGILETEFEDRSDIKTQVIKAIAPTMEGENEEERKKNAGNSSIESVERMGKYNPQRIRPVKVKFGNKSDVDHLLRNKKRLPKDIYVDKEYSKATEKERRILRPILKAAKRIKKYKTKCRMEGTHVVIDGKHYHRNNLHTLPDELNTFDVTSTSNTECLGFFGELHPFSNFHPCQIKCDGEEFNSSEQYIQWKKACYFKDRQTSIRILNSEDAMESKDISRDINNFDRKSWNEVAEEICYEGVKQKFLQNQHLLEELLKTGEKILVESSYDDVWGTGVPLSHKNCLVKESWKSIGILGRMLMNIRDSITNIEENSMEGDETGGDT